MKAIINYIEWIAPNTNNLPSSHEMILTDISPEEWENEITKKLLELGDCPIFYFSYIIIPLEETLTNRYLLARKHGIKAFFVDKDREYQYS